VLTVVLWPWARFFYKPWHSLGSGGFIRKFAAAQPTTEDVLRPKETGVDPKLPRGKDGAKCEMFIGELVTHFEVMRRCIVSILITSD